MLRTLLASAMLSALATAGFAQPVEQIPGGARAQRTEGDPVAPRPRLFISPFGEPFRMANGLEAWLAGADTNHDGAVTLDEFRADAQRFFKVLDANHDGTIDGFEIQAYETEIAPEITGIDFDDGGRGRGGRRGGGGSGGGIRAGGAEGAARFSLLNVAEPVAGADETLDGRVSAAEWDRAVTRRFEKLDRDKSGRLTAASLRAPPAGKKP